MGELYSAVLFLSRDNTLKKTEGTCPAALIKASGGNLSAKFTGICYHWNGEACQGFTKKL